MHKSGSRNVERLAGCAPVEAAGTKRLVESFSRHSRRAKHPRVGTESGGSSRELTGTCELQGGLQTELSTLFDGDRFGADRQRDVRLLEEVAVDRVAVVHDDFFERRYFEPFEFAQRERLVNV
jgi:hypothetical protein